MARYARRFRLVKRIFPFLLAVTLSLALVIPISCNYTSAVLSCLREENGQIHCQRDVYWMEHLLVANTSLDGPREARLLEKPAGTVWRYQVELLTDSGPVQLGRVWDDKSKMLEIAGAVNRFIADPSQNELRVEQLIPVYAHILHWGGVAFGIVLVLPFTPRIKVTARRQLRTSKASPIPKSMTGRAAAANQRQTAR